MPERRPGPPEDEGWRDIHLDDIVRGVGSLIGFVSSVAESLSSGANQSRTPAARPVNRGQPLAHLDPGAAEPAVDLFDEGAEIVLVVDWRDGDAGQVEVSVQDDVLSLGFGGAAPAVDLLLPGVVDPASLRLSARNGISEIRLRRA